MTVGHKIVGVAVTAAVAYWAWVRPRLARWGATDEELTGAISRRRAGPRRQEVRGDGRHDRRAAGSGLAVAGPDGLGPWGLVLLGPPRQRRPPQRPGSPPGVARPRRRRPAEVLDTGRRHRRLQGCRARTEPLLGTARV